MTYFFWTGLAIVLYTYAGYPVVLWVLVKIKKFFFPKQPTYFSEIELPEITLIIACYNEADFLPTKIENTLALKYPIDRKKVYFVTDGSNDNSLEIIRNYGEIELFHEDERRGKNAAVNRVLPYVKTPIVVFCDANTLLNEEALICLARHYKDPAVGAVAGEKRVIQSGNAAGNEGFYWKYESMLKKCDSELRTVVGAAGELFSIRTELFEEVPPNVIIEDFRLSMNIAKKGYRVVYEPSAIAVETASESIADEKKRKVRISAGGLIEVVHFLPLLNFIKYGLLSFQYVSHRMLRWTLAPLSLLVVLLSNLLLTVYSPAPFYLATMLAQLLFYGLALIGYLMRNKNVNFKITFIPYYFLFMNFSVFQGLLRLINGKQSAIWEKARRSSSAPTA